MTQRWRNYPPLDRDEHIPKDDLWNWDAWFAYCRRIIVRARELGWTSVGLTTICDPPIPSGVPPEKRDDPDATVETIPDLFKEPLP